LLRERYDLLHVQGIHTLVPPLAMLAAMMMGTPFLISLHSGGHASPIRRAIRRPQHLVLRPLIGRARRIIAVSRFERDAFAASLGISRRRFEIIPNGADLPTPRARAFPGAYPLIVSVGRLERYKGHHRIVDAMPHILARQPTAMLVIAGSGPQEGELRRRAVALGVAPHVRIAPVEPDDRQAMADLLGAASVVAVLSQYESHGLAAVEAAGLGRPLVVSDATALRDLVRRGEARGVPLGATPMAIGASLLDEAERPPRAHDAPPTWDACAAALAGCYRQVLGIAA
jgi:glycosyltransferase involved in cell wall biosynthesis